MGQPGAGEVAAAELAAVLEQFGIRVEPISGSQTGDLLAAEAIAIKVKTASRPSLGWLRRLVRDQRTDPSILHVLVADHIDPGMRDELERLGWGWLDRSGHLRLVREGLQIDRQIPSLSGPEVALVDPLSRPTGRAVAVCLLEGTGAESVRELATLAGVSTGAAHAALVGLRELGLLEAGGRRDPDLFWALAARWSVRWYALSAGPLPGPPESVQRLLRFGCDDRDKPGWAEVGDRVAQVYGARLGTEAARKFYVPDQRALTWALRTWEVADDDRRATAWLAVPPTSAVTERRVELGHEFLAARPIVVALDLAADGSPRSRDVLDEWQGTPGRQARVW